MQLLQCQDPDVGHNFLGQIRAIVDIISKTCAFPTMTVRNVCCEKGLFWSLDGCYGAGSVGINKYENNVYIMFYIVA